MRSKAMTNANMSTCYRGFYGKPRIVRTIVTILILVFHISLSSCVTAKYDNPFRKVDYSNPTIEPDDTILKVIVEAEKSKDFNHIQSKLETSFIAPNLASGNYLAIVLDSNSIIRASFDRNMLGLLIDDIFVSQVSWKKRLPITGFRIGYSVYKFTDGYFWVHQVVQSVPNSSCFLLEFLPEGDHLYGYSNPIF